MKREFFLYGAISAIALTVDISILYAAITSVAMPAYIAAALAYAVGLIVHYLLSIRYAFAFRRLAGNQRAELSIYALTGLLGIAISATIVHVGGLLGQSLLVSKMAAIVTSFFTIYIIRKLTLFSATTKHLKSAP